MRQFAVVVMLFLINSICLSKAKPKAVVSPESVKTPGVETSDANFREIFEGNLRQSQVDLYSARDKYLLEFSMIAGSPAGTVLSNEYYDLDYGTQVSNRSSFGFYFGKILSSESEGQWQPQVGVGYSLDENILMAESKTGGSYKDVIRFQTIPLYVGIKGQKSLDFSFPIVLSSKLGFLYEWISINGGLDGINHSQWVPGVYGQAGVTFFTVKQPTLETWFAGLDLSAGMSRSIFAKSEKNQSNYLSLGLNFFL